MVAESPSRTKHVPIHERALWRAGELAGMFGVDIVTIRRMNEAELIPSPVRIGNSGGVIAWRADEIRSWLAAGCPDRSGWIWIPALVPKLTDLRDQLNQEIQTRQREIRQYEAQLIRVRHKLRKQA